MDLKELYLKSKELLGKEVTLQGWIRNHRKQKDFGFIDFSDGTCYKHIQLVYTSDLQDFEEIAKLHIGCAITVTGTLTTFTTADTISFILSISFNKAEPA